MQQIFIKRAEAYHKTCFIKTFDVILHFATEKYDAEKKILVHYCFTYTFLTLHK